MRHRLRLLPALLLAALAPATAAAQTPPLPHYDLAVRVDVAAHLVHVRERVVWTNRHRRPAAELTFNVHARYKLPDKDVGMTAKMFEILRVMPGETLDLEGKAGEVTGVRLVPVPQPAGPPPTPGLRTAGATADDDTELPPPRLLQPEGETLPPPRPLVTATRDLRFDYQQENECALVVPLPRPVQQGESVAVEIDYTLKLPQRQGRWGQWLGVTFLSNWLPVLAFYDDAGWQPTPYIPWHQPFFNEAGLYRASVILPADQQVACTAPVLAGRDLGDGTRQLDFAPCYARDFALLCSDRFQEWTARAAGGVRVRCLAFPKHEHYARYMLESACEALAAYAAWFGPYPYPEFTIVESYFGWNTNECAGLLMVDERIFDMAHSASGFVDYVIAHGTCHQWWYNVVGTNGYAETWMDEGFATYFGHRLVRQKYGKNDPLVRYPRALRWLPNVRREDYRYFNLYGTLGRGEAGPTVQEIPKYGHLVNLYGMAYERGGKVLGMLEDRLGKEKFFAFMRHIYGKYGFRVLRVADFQRELEAYTGRTWNEFFHDWVYGAGTTDWCVEEVRVRRAGQQEGFTDLLPWPLTLAVDQDGPCDVTVVVHQTAEITEPTVLGFSLDGSQNFQVRVPVITRDGPLELDEYATKVEVLAHDRVRVRVTLPRRPTQIAVDPDQVLLDRDPINNYWKPRVNCRFTPLYTFLDETDLTNAYDRWNVIAGPWVFVPTYDNPFFTRSTRFGLRAAGYRTGSGEGGVYTAYRTDYRDFVMGADMLLEHWPLTNTEVGMVVERRLAGTLRGETQANRGVLYGRYIIDYGDSLYLPPFQYVEAFGTIQDDLLPFARQTLPGAERFKHQGLLGAHYHLNYLTPYWDAEGGFAVDLSYAAGVEAPGLGEATDGVHQFMGQATYVQSLPDGLGWLSDTRFAFRVYGAFGLPSQVQYFALGGGELFRGFDLAQRQGSSLWVGSVEWRVPLAQHVNWGICDRAFTVRNVYGAAFCDVGDVYLKGQSVGGVAEAAGFGLRLDVSWFTFVERTIFRIDAAQTINANTPTQFWVGLEHPF